ncbi:MAG: YggS family pyridoxal phosphate-dependent enzyme [Spirochaetales bacterium]|nr:YggS family pyridoxal phosphate-dependent enzyme [Spirochaetales bacterium]
MNKIKENYDHILENVKKAQEKSGRKNDVVRVMAVTKTKSIDIVESAYSAGFRLFGENRIQEAGEKFSDFHKDAQLHIIGHLQSNKVKKAVEISSCIQSVDRLKIAKMIDKFCIEFSKTIEVYLEYNTSGEESKSGFVNEEDFFQTLEEIIKMENIQIKGLMTIGPLSNNESAIRKSFTYLRNLRDKANAKYPDAGITGLSMGMSGDYEIAVEEGATLIRVGTALFGERY